MQQSTLVMFLSSLLILCASTGTISPAPGFAEESLVRDSDDSWHNWTLANCNDELKINKERLNEKKTKEAYLGIARALVRRGSLTERAGDFDTALIDFQEAIDVCHRAQRDKMKCSATIEVWAYALIRKGRLLDLEKSTTANARQCYTRAIKVCSKNEIDNEEKILCRKADALMWLDINKFFSARIKPSVRVRSEAEKLEGLSFNKSLKLYNDQINQGKSISNWVFEGKTETLLQRGALEQIRKCYSSAQATFNELIATADTAQNTAHSSVQLQCKKARALGSLGYINRDQFPSQAQLASTTDSPPEQFFSQATRTLENVHPNTPDEQFIVDYMRAILLIMRGDAEKDLKRISSNDYNLAINDFNLAITACDRLIEKYPVEYRNYWAKADSLIKRANVECCLAEQQKQALASFDQAIETCKAKLVQAPSCTPLSKQRMVAITDKEKLVKRMQLKDKYDATP